MFVSELLKQISSADLSFGKLPVESRKFCPVGKLLPGVQVVVMDDDLNVKPVGVRGEVSIRRALLLLYSTFNTT
jgi:acyl-coenzyme A synthetase/AMP-(fatty) acid ligase